MTEHLTIGSESLAYDLEGDGPLVVLAHGMGDSRRSYRFLVPGLVAAGYRVANVDLRGCGESSTGWDGYSRTDIAGDLVALVRHLGGPAVIIGQSISGGAATIAAATAPDLVAGRRRARPLHPRAVGLPRRVVHGAALPQGHAAAHAHRPPRQHLGLDVVPRPGRAGQARRLGRRAGPDRRHAGASRGG